MTRFMNLTPHDIVIRTSSGDMRRILSTGYCRAVPSGSHSCGEIDGVRIYSLPYYAGVEGLPEPQEDVVYIVSQLALAHIEDRLDVVSPDTGPESAIRDKNGAIIAIRRLLIKEKMTMVV